MTTTSTSRRNRSMAATVLAGCACAAALAACGGSSSSDGGSHPSYVGYARCVRAHGVPSFPDPIVSPNGIVALAAGTDMASPAFTRAQRTCAHLLPPPITKAPARFEQQWLRVARCMRAQGLQSFPDPTTTMPADRAATMTLAVGLYLNLGAAGVSPASPAFQRAGNACHFPGIATLATAAESSG